jgi:ABC-type Co2+ transport system permease subunit
MDVFGAAAFGVVIGWITYRTLRRTSERAQVSDIASVIGAVGGAAVTAIFQSEVLFGWYAVGLFVGFFAYLILGFTLLKDVDWLGDGT